MCTRILNTWNNNESDTANITEGNELFYILTFNMHVLNEVLNNKNKLKKNNLMLMNIIKFVRILIFVKILFIIEIITTLKKCIWLSHTL